MANLFRSNSATRAEDGSPPWATRDAFSCFGAARLSPSCQRRLSTMTTLLLLCLLSPVSESEAVSFSRCARGSSSAASALASPRRPSRSLSSDCVSLASRAGLRLTFVSTPLSPSTPCSSSCLTISTAGHPHALPSRPSQVSLPCASRASADPAGSPLFAGCCGSQGRSCGSEKGAVSPQSGNKGAVIPRVGTTTAGPRPDWFHVPAPHAASRGAEESRYQQLQRQIRGLDLHTVCEEAQCPNIGECWNGGTATLILLGDTCTRGCRFCAIKTSSKPPPPDPLEPEKVADAVAKWDIDYVVMTSVDRDDMPDGGAGHFARTVQLVKKAKPSMLIECLVSDFQGMEESVRTLAQSGLDVYAHNIETVRRLTPYVRDKRAKYDQSLRVLQLAKKSNPSLFTKSSIMVGLGETEEEVVQTLRDLRAHDVDVVTLGQYLRPTKQQLGVVEYVAPETFKKYQEIAEKMGFKYVASGPLVRSSYKAGEYFMKHLIDGARKNGREAVKQVKLEADVGTMKGTTTTFGANE
uniref:Lipoyl synthase, apicoplast n=1 Tax=Neospora caninum (strain Liverpool) TaxID=572307 RepID=A0A0F7UK86_NEOCL|nr:TPA: Lipoic acid synthetase, related [Neospora caninum Liverpool]